MDFWETAAADRAIWKLAEVAFFLSLGFSHILPGLKIILQKQITIMYIIHVYAYYIHTDTVHALCLHSL